MKGKEALNADDFEFESCRVACQNVYLPAYQPPPFHTERVSNAAMSTLTTNPLPSQLSPKPRRVGRPRAFNRDHALEAAMRVFWRRGYEGASLTELTRAMGINRPSLYAAFGDKAALFRESVARYGVGPGRYVRRALGRPTARQVAETLLRGAVAAATDETMPRGCLWVQGALVAAAESENIRQEMAALRDGGTAQIEERLERARRDGDLPQNTDVAALTLYLVSVMNGISVQAAGGKSREALHRVVELALTAFPAALPTA
jgi:AcrR family transcriptional regulator